jgi:tetratricopeptide (TPR) repeat protein
MIVAPRNSNIYLKVVAALIFMATMVIGVCAQDQGAPNEAERLMSVAKAAQEQGQYDDAIRAYRQVVVLSKDSPKNAALAYYNAGVLYLRFKKYEDAVNAFRQSILLDPNSAEANNNLGEALGALKQYPAAVTAFQRAVALDGNLLIAQFNMGLTYNQMGQPQYAITQTTRLVTTAWP